MEDEEIKPKRCRIYGLTVKAYSLQKVERKSDSFSAVSRYYYITGIYTYEEAGWLWNYPVVEEFSVFSKDGKQWYNLSDGSFVHAVELENAYVGIVRKYEFEQALSTWNVEVVSGYEPT